MTATVTSILVLSALLVADAHAQRGGARGGVASSGSFSTSSATVGTNTGGRPSQLPAKPGQLPTKPGQLPSDGRGDWDAGDNAPAFVAGAVVGAAAAARRGYGASGAFYYEPLTTLPCTPKEINVGSVKYYQCGSEYFMQAYDGGSVLYVQVDPPPQY